MISISLKRELQKTITLLYSVKALCNNAKCNIALVTITSSIPPSQVGLDSQPGSPQENPGVVIKVNPVRSIIKRSICSETSQTGEPGSTESVGASPRREPLPPPPPKLEANGWPREKRGRLEVWRVPLFESWLNAADRVHYFVILLIPTAEVLYTSENSWTAKHKPAWRYPICSFHLHLTFHTHPAASSAENGRDPLSSYTGSSGWRTGPVRLCMGLKLQGLHTITIMLP
jgi:hypothetical protein